MCIIYLFIAISQVQVPLYAAIKGIKLTWYPDPD